MAEIEQEGEWIGLFRKVANSPELTESYQTQIAVLDNLFPPQRKKKMYTLPQWHMENRENDLILYYALGFLHPTEREFLYHHMVRWANNIMERERSNLDESKIAPDGSAVINIPRPTVSRFFKDWARDNFVQHENLLMRLQPAMKIVSRLEDALYDEGTRGDPDEWVSAMDELMCQDIYPANEQMCWVWMNKMAAPRNRSLFCMDLSGAREALKELNWFRINRVMADYRDFAEKPVVTQRINGKLQSCEIPWISAKIAANQKFLSDYSLIDERKISGIEKMDKKERDKAELMLEQNAVAAFLEDMARAAPSREWLVKMERQFENYFHPILEKVGYPVMQFETSQIEDKKGNSQKWHIIRVSFNPKQIPVSRRISKVSER